MLASKHGADKQWVTRCRAKAEEKCHGTVPQRVLLHFAKEVPVWSQTILQGNHKPIAAVRIGNGRLFATIDGGHGAEGCIRIWNTTTLGGMECIAYQTIDDYNIGRFHGGSQLHYLDGCNRIVFNPNQWDGGRSPRFFNPAPEPEKIFGWDFDGKSLSPRQSLTLLQPMMLAVAPDDGTMYCAQYTLATNSTQLHKFAFGDTLHLSLPALQGDSFVYLTGEHSNMAVCGIYVIVLDYLNGLTIFRRDNLSQVHRLHFRVEQEPQLCVENNSMFLWCGFQGVEGLHQMTLNDDGTIDVANNSILIRQSDYFSSIYGCWNGHIYVKNLEDGVIEIFDTNSGKRIKSLQQQHRCLRGVFPVEDEVYFIWTRYPYCSKSATFDRFIL